MRQISAGYRMVRALTRTAGVCSRSGGAEALFEPGGVAVSQQARLRDPVVAADTPLKTSQLRVDPVDIGVAPTGDLVEAGDAQFAQRRGELGAKALDAC